MKILNHNSQQLRNRESGIALIMALLALFVLSLAVAAMTSTGQQEVWTSSNFRATTQARYVAESGANAALQFLKSSQYVLPSQAILSTTSFPLQTTSGTTLVLANGSLTTANGTLSSTYSDPANSGVPAAFNTAISNNLASLSHLQGLPQASTTVAAQMLSYSYNSGNPITTWKISSLGSVNPSTVATVGRGNVLVQEIVTLNPGGTTNPPPQMIPGFNDAVFANGTGCGAITINGGSSTNAYSALANLGNLTPPLMNNSAPVATFGNVNLSGSGFVLGNVFAPGYNLIDPASDNSGWGQNIAQPGVAGQAPSGGHTYNFNDSCGAAGASNAQKWAANVTGGSGIDCTSTNAGSCKNDPQNMPSTVTVHNANGTTSTVALNSSTYTNQLNTPIGYTCNGSPCSATSANAVPSGFEQPGHNATACNYGLNYANPPVCAGGSGSGSANGAVYGYYNPSITLPPSDANPNSVVNYGNVTFGGQAVVTLQAGTYYFNSLTVTGAASIVMPATGNVTIYVINDKADATQPSGYKSDSYSTTPVNFTGGTLSNPGGNPARMEVVYNGTNTVNVGSISNSPYFGTIYAPNANVSFNGNGSIYGAVIGKTVSITGGGHVYYDTDLAGASSPGWYQPSPTSGPPTWTVQQFSWTPW